MSRNKFLYSEQLKNKKNFFHIHTYRCGHAENIPDKIYVLKAIELGATDIWFTDHAPFPSNPFDGRMPYANLEEYIRTLLFLKDRYKEKINIHIGLEIEYIPDFDKQGYYQELKEREEIEILLLGQHFLKTKENLSLTKEQIEKEEYRILGNAIIEGIQSGYFDIVAHPDRIFRKRKEWTKDMQDMTDNMISMATHSSIPLEFNIGSFAKTNAIRSEFWESIQPNNQIVVGLDSHSIDDMISRSLLAEKYQQQFKI